MLPLGVWVDGVLVGSQALETENFLVTKTAETGSWLGREFQHRGIGTAIRRVVCTFAFDHLGAAEIGSGAFTDNPSSLRVSAKVGYRPNGLVRMKRREGELAVLQKLRLVPDDLIRGEHPVTVEGLTDFRQSIGLDPTRPLRRPSSSLPLANWVEMCSMARKGTTSHAPAKLLPAGASEASGRPRWRGTHGSPSPGPGPGR